MRELWEFARAYQLDSTELQGESGGAFGLDASHNPSPNPSYTHTHTHNHLVDIIHTLFTHLCYDFLLAPASPSTSLSQQLPDSNLHNHAN